MALSEISMDPDVLQGVPVVTGTTISVSAVVALVCEGLSEQEIIERHPQLTPADIVACVEFQHAGSR
ncbi:DUF433 domain-containing protein [Allokutzneria sp. NRRL B-24872]|uniref:DUF433 domain-containing protein n=1 Tax=Allokutzneria sp. NRRL B-24872 TaxID=1137961 RepID=UPI00143DABC7|nr:DUF433 domain-containing protein [Allokutzneria sp. NRRL B-24872]